MDLKKNNQLKGPIPPIGTLKNLKYLYLSFNKLYGPIPPIITLKKLHDLDLRDNCIKKEDLKSYVNTSWGRLITYPQNYDDDTPPTDDTPSRKNLCNS